MNQSIRFVIVGSGNIANTYIAAIQNIGNAQTIGIVSRNQTTPSNYPDIPSWTSLESIDKPFDAVIICTPNAYHHVAAIEAAHMNKHVLCEKPIDISLNSIDRMIEACKQNHVKLAVAYQRRFSSDNPLVKDLIDQNKLGRIFSVEIGRASCRERV